MLISAGLCISEGQKQMSWLLYRWYRTSGCPLRNRSASFGYVTDDIKVSRQCLQSHNTDIKIIGLINRSITVKSREVMFNLYKTLVRPHVEYCTPVWSPHYEKDRCLIEKAQRHFTKMVKGMVRHLYPERLRQLALWSLEERRSRADLLHQ